MSGVETLPLPGDATPQRRGGKPVEVGGLIRVLCDDAHGQRVTADLDVEGVQRLGCGCWEAWTTRPGETRPRSMYVIFSPSRCGHDDGGGAGAQDQQPQVIRFGPE